jgi:hypothetical protein
MFATMKHRTYKSKGCESRETDWAMAFKLTQQAQGKWRRINALHLVKDAADGVMFVNGESVNPPNNGPTEEQEKDMTTEKIAA